MCGIIGYIGNSPAKNIIFGGLKRLEYRGYDSAGIAVVDAKLHRIRALGEVDNLIPLMQSLAPASVGIGHTRWATHGGVTLDNTHPHTSYDGNYVLVHNGIIENYQILKDSLQKHGITFYGQTDTEVLVNLIAFVGKGMTLTQAVQCALAQVEGTYGIAVIQVDNPTQIVATRKGSPLVLGVGINEMFVASDAMAITRHTNNIIYLNDGDVATVSATDVAITDGKIPVIPKICTVDAQALDSDLQGFRFFMEKEMMLQPNSLKNTLRGRVSQCKTTTKFGGLNLSTQQLRAVNQVFMTGCGTAWHAALVTKHLMERYARIHVEVDVASEFRYRQPPVSDNPLAFFLSQSGETIDTLACLREFKRRGVPSLGIVNSVGSSIAREVDGGVYQHVGMEIGVASTKAFTSQVLIGAMLSTYFGRLHDLDHNQGARIVSAFLALPELMEQTLLLSPQIDHLVSKYLHVRDFMFLGRQEFYPVALEAALKLKEIAYVNATGYPSAEMKHGPIAMVSAQCPAMLFIPDNDLVAKNISNMQEIYARGGPIIVVTNHTVSLPSDLVCDRINVPKSPDPIIDPILFVLPAQLFAFHFARRLGLNVDKPRNLAKAVTVE